MSVLSLFGMGYTFGVKSPNFALLAAAVFFGCGSTTTTTGTPTATSTASASTSASASVPSPSAKPRVVVSLVVDQLALWEALERWPTLPRTGGFAKLVGEANAISELHFQHAHNATAPGHAALYTGASPHDSGITANARPTKGDKFVSSLEDESARLVLSTGAASRAGSSLATLRVPTVGDALREADPTAIIISLSIKDRGAVFGGGRKSNLTMWFDASTDAFVSSTAFVDALPSWASDFTKPGAGARYRPAAWGPLDRKWLEQHADIPGPDLGQGDFFGLGKFFDHDLGATKPAPRAFVATPFSDVMLGELAEAAVDQIASSGKPALLAVSLSANDYVGHVFGPDSPESWDDLLRLDATLGKLFAHLDEKLGADGYAVVLSADHGVPPTPEVMNQGFCKRPDPDRFERRCDTATRLLPKDLVRAAEEAADHAVGEGAWILSVSEPFVVFTPEARALEPAKFDALVAAVTKSLAAVPGIGRVIDVRSSPKQCPEMGDESLDALLCRSIAGSTGGDLFLLTKPGSFIDTGYVEGDGVNHGTPYLFDRAVPIVVRAPRAAGAPTNNVADALAQLNGNLSVDQRAFARSIASLLDVPPPPLAAAGTDLAKASIR
ncbi:MAG: alkaline phosphatase family protein [Polyangiaceae bacterium]